MRASRRKSVLEGLDNSDPLEASDDTDDVEAMPPKRKRGGGVELTSEGRDANQRHDRASRKSGGSVRGWIQGAVKHPGVFTAAAKKAGKTTRAYAQEHKGDSGTLGKRARLALTLEGMHKK